MRFRGFWAPLLMALGLALTAGEAAAQTSRDKVLYLACYMFTPGGDGTAIAFIPHTTTAGVLGRIYPESRLTDSGVIAARGYRTSRCASFDTAEQAEAWYRASGYLILNKFGYPKGFWPDAPAPAPPSGDIAGMGAAKGSAKTAPPPTAPSKAPAQISKPALTIKTDTRLRDAGKVWDEQVKKTLAEEAKKKVETAAKTAQANAKAKADAEAFFKERRKQGRAQ